MKDDDSAHRLLTNCYLFTACGMFLYDGIHIAAMDASELQAPVGLFCTCSHSLLRDHKHSREGRWGICLMAGCYCRKGEVRIEKDDKVEKAK